MHKTTISLVAIASTLLSSAPTVSAQNSKIIPCTSGNGTDEVCGSCDESKAIEVTAWEQATWVKNFTMANAGAENGLGYRIFWKVEQPGEGCRIVLFDTFNSDKGSIEPKLSGRVRLSVNKGGCYVTTVRSGGVGAGACCWDDCKKIGAYPGAVGPPKPPSRVMRSVTSSDTRSLLIREREQYEVLQNRRHKFKLGKGSALTQDRFSKRVKLEHRDRGDQKKNPFATKPKPEEPKWNCKAEPSSGTYTKSGKQVVDGSSFPCLDISCDMNRQFQASVGSTISSEKTTTYTNSQGTTHQVSVGAKIGGEIFESSVEYSFAYNKQFSEAVSKSTGTSQTDTKTTGVIFSQKVTAGFLYNAWWAPTLTCQTWTLSCDQGEGPIEKCDPLLDANGNLVGEQGIMTTGRA